MEEYKFSNEDLIEVFGFVVNYHLNLTKGLRGRTNTGSRGFGGELEEFLPGKLLEIACCRILEKQNEDKIKLFPDFKIYDNKEVGERSDPDITKVLENNMEREPKVFIEIKRLSENSVWIGPRKHQFQKGKDGFMIHGDIRFKDENNIKQQDIIGSVLKEIINEKFCSKININSFSNFYDLTASIRYIYPFDLIRKMGGEFKQGEIIPDTDFPESVSIINKDGSMRKDFAKVESYNENKIIELEMMIEKQIKNESPRQSNFGKWQLQGNFVLYKKQSTGMNYLHCIQDTSMFNQVFGRYLLKKDKCYRFYLVNKLGKNKYKGTDDFWFSKKRLDELVLEDKNLTVENQIQLISRKI